VPVEKIFKKVEETPQFPVCAAVTDKRYGEERVKRRKFAKNISQKR
jgi:hypothetical protein